MKLLDWFFDSVSVYLQSDGGTNKPLLAGEFGSEAEKRCLMFPALVFVSTFEEGSTLSRRGLQNSPCDRFEESEFDLFHVKRLLFKYIFSHHILFLTS